ncbi:MAG TPA: hypothetical protein P5084_12000 [Paludibacter sp.]|nr:hypothetical protein [Paludibacter sp.]
MILDLKGNTVTTVHKICISNYKKDKFLTTLPNLQWTDNFNLACCFESEQEAFEFSENENVQEVIGDELELYIWSDTKQSIYENLD